MMIREKTAALCVFAIFILGCGASPAPQGTTEDPQITDTGPAETATIPASSGFSWVVPGELAAMPLPGRDRPLDQDAAFLESEEIRVLVSLTEEPPDPEVLASHSIEHEHLPVTDYSPPSLEQMAEFTALVEHSVAEGRPVGVHCAAGLGRSGTMSAAYLVAIGASADDAITIIRELRPGSIETPAQEDAIRQFEESLDQRQ